MREKFRELVKRKNKIHANLELVQWDLETKTPLKSKPYLSELVGELSMQDYALSTSFIVFFFSWIFFKKGTISFFNSLKKTSNLSVSIPFS